MAEIVLHSETLYKGKVVHLRVDTIQTADGKPGKREIVAHAGAVCIVALTPENEILLVRQFRLAAETDLLEVPAGKREPNEDPTDCALRELEEETGYRAGKISPLFSAYTSPGYSTEKIFAFFAFDLVQTQTHFDEGEQIELIKVPVSQIESLLASGKIEDMKTIAALSAALKREELRGVQVN